MQVCTSLQTDNHASTPPLCFLQAGCPSCRPTNSVKALKAKHQSGEMGVIKLYRLIAHCLENISAKNYQNRLISVEIKASDISVVYWGGTLMSDALSSTFINRFDDNFWRKCFRESALSNDSFRPYFPPHLTNVSALPGKT